DQGDEIVAGRSEQRLTVGRRKLPAGEGGVEEPTDRRGGAGDRALDGVIAQRDGLDLFPRVEPAHDVEASSVTDGETGAEIRGPANRARSEATSHPARVT